MRIMQTSPQTFRDLIDLWPSPAECATDVIASGCLVTVGMVKQWRRRNSIPAAYFSAIILAGKKAGLPITSDAIVCAAARLCHPNDLSLQTFGLHDAGFDGTSLASSSADEVAP